MKYRNIIFQKYDTVKQHKERRGNIMNETLRETKDEIEELKTPRATFGKLRMYENFTSSNFLSPK